MVVVVAFQIMLPDDTAFITLKYEKYMSQLLSRGRVRLEDICQCAVPYCLPDALLENDFKERQKRM